MFFILSNASNNKKDVAIQSEKVPVVYFSIAIAIINGAFIIVQYKHHGRQIFTRARICIQVALSLSSILYALLPYCTITFAKIVSEKPQSLDCKIWHIGRGFNEQCVPFIYGFGLVALCLDWILTSEVGSNIKNRLCQWIGYPVLSAILPWLIGVLLWYPRLQPNTNRNSYCQLSHQSINREVAAQSTIEIFLGMCSMIAGMAVVMISFRRTRPYHYCQLSVCDNKLDVSSSTGMVKLDERQPVTSPLVFDNPSVSLTGQQDKNRDALCRPEPDRQTTSCCSQGMIMFVPCIVFSCCVVPYHAFKIYLVGPFAKPSRMEDFTLEVSDTELVMSSCFYWLLNLYHIINPTFWLLQSFKRPKSVLLDV